jgi:hypothetical protein
MWRESWLFEIKFKAWSGGTFKAAVAAETLEEAVKKAESYKTKIAMEADIIAVRSLGVELVE